MPEDYLEIHNWFDATKAHLADFRHRALRHHAEGIFLCEQIFGVYITNSDGQQVPVRTLGEQHVKEDLGRIPTACDWLRCLPAKVWMLGRSEAMSEDEQLPSELATTASCAEAS